MRELLHLKDPLAWLGLLLAVVLLATPIACQVHRKRAAEARVNEAQADAAREAGRDAVETVGRAATREAQGDALTRSNDKEIRNAQGADARVHPDAHAAGLDSLCRRAAYRDSERCRLREPAPR
ncbi:hypothetical protein [Sphingomicrobium sediminis]|uniref:Uncharacterized protein n=1 Tax=Sphingomicrobium sediminis TaxID=2950949 RepID=A0A9X2J2F3_9SPHN|nr:hypothetical protein [Sphingomicrobium sediminis]MCM8557739.1 hypothetical protein [Sphingomicrobium sediminis]